MRLPAPILLLIAAACAPVDARDQATDNGTAEVDPGQDTGVTNAANEDAALLPPMDIAVHTGHCSRGSWIAGPLARGGARRRLTCSTVTVTYRERRPGYTDTNVSILKRDAAQSIVLGTVWEAEDRLAIHAATLGEGEPVKVGGSCKGRFVRPSDRYFASGGSAEEAAAEMDDATEGAAPKRERLDCTVNDLQGNPIGAISFF